VEGDVTEGLEGHGGWGMADFRGFYTEWVKLGGAIEVNLNLGLADGLNNGLK
jgi:hypothetical protein